MVTRSGPGSDDVHARCGGSWRTRLKLQQHYRFQEQLDNDGCQQSFEGKPVLELPFRLDNSGIIKEGI